MSDDNQMPPLSEIIKSVEVMFTARDNIDQSFKQFLEAVPDPMKAGLDPHNPEHVKMVAEKMDLGAELLVEAGRDYVEATKRTREVLRRIGDAGIRRTTDEG